MISQKPHSSGSRRSERELRRLCHKALGGLNLDLPLDAGQLCERFGERRGRRITILPHPLPAGMPSGVWLIGDEEDFFFYQANTTKTHQDQIIIHEFGHLIAGHQVVGAAPTAAGLDFAEASRDALSRTCYADDREWEAEMVATLIGEWADRATGAVVETPKHPGLRGLQRTLGGHRGWL